METLLSQNPDPRSRDFASADPRQDGRTSKNVGRAAWTTLAVLAGVALALRAGDAIPGWISGVPRGVHLCASVEQAEARTGLHLGAIRQGLGGYAFTTGGIRATARPVPAVAIALQGGQGASQLTIFRSRGGAIPATLRPPLPSFHEITVPLQIGRTASLKAERQTDGTVWQDVEWSDGTSSTALRSSGRTVELLRLARQLSGDPR
jgi:hypothetical protein